MHFTDAISSVGGKTQNNSPRILIGELVPIEFSSHGGFLTNTEKQRNNRIKLTHYDETNKRAHDSQIELKKTSSSATVGPANDKHQAPIQHYQL